VAILNFNAQTVAPSAAFEPLPAGWYNVKITDSELKPTRAGDGNYIALTMEVLDGNYAGRKVFTNLNVDNKNEIAVKIAYEQLSALCYVTGNIQLQDTQQLHGIPFQTKLTVKEASGGYDASNDVKGFRDQHGREPKELAGGGAPSAPSAGAPAAPAAPAAPSAPAAPKAPAAPAAPVVDPLAAAVADGWVKHPETEGYHYKGTDVVADADLIAKYGAPAAPPAVPAAPAAPAGVAGTDAPPWKKNA